VRQGCSLPGWNEYLYREVILAELLSFQLAEKFPAFCETWGFVTASTTALHWIWASAHALTLHFLNICHVTVLHSYLQLFHSRFLTKVLHALQICSKHTIRSLQRPSFDAGTADVGFVVDILALGHLSFLQARQFSLVSIIQPRHHTHISFTYHRRCLILITDSGLNRTLFLSPCTLYMPRSSHPLWSDDRDSKSKR
jgi:hypothetical protein